jgi:hypothetical protein
MGDLGGDFKKNVIKHVSHSGAIRRHCHDWSGDHTPGQGHSTQRWRGSETWVNFGGIIRVLRVRMTALKKGEGGWGLVGGDATHSQRPKLY